GVVDEGGELSTVERGHVQILADAPVPAHPNRARSCGVRPPVRCAPPPPPLPPASPGPARLRPRAADLTARGRRPSRDAPDQSPSAVPGPAPDRPADRPLGERQGHGGAPLRRAGAEPRRLLPRRR